MDSTCFPSGFSYLLAFGMGFAAVVLSSWLVMLMRAAYRDDGDFRSRFMNSAPLWAPALGGIAALFLSGNSLRGWVEKCLRADDWSAAGTIVLGLGLVLALIAAVRLIVGRVRAGRAGERLGNRDDVSPQPSSASPGKAEEPQPRLPPERGRVIVEYALTYGAAVIVILIGVGLA